MPAIVSGPPQQSEHMWQALKNHITRERQRKKQGFNLVSKIIYAFIFIIMVFLYHFLTIFICI